MPQSDVEIARALLPGPETNVAELIRDEEQFAAIMDAIGRFLDPELEATPAWRGAGETYSGLDGFREMWLDWLEPWASYHVHVEDVFEHGDSVVVLVRDRARRHGVDAEVELISGSDWTFRDGKVVRARFFANREQLRDTLGLES